MANVRGKLPKHLFRDRIQVRSNLHFTMYDDRGKRVARRKGHNIFLTLGRTWLPQAISYSALPAGFPPAATPVTKADERGIRYMGFGIGGTRGDTAVANVSPLLEHYPGTNVQTDTDPEVTVLERPVRLTSPIPGTPVEPPYDADDIWLGQVAAPPEYPTSTSVRYSMLLTADQISYGPFLTVPLSEIGLFLHSSASSYIRTYNNTAVAYDTFDDLKKTSAFSLLTQWELRFLCPSIAMHSLPGTAPWPSWKGPAPRLSPTGLATTSSTSTTAVSAQTEPRRTAR